MVKLEEVVDEEFLREQDGPQDDDDWDTDSDSDASSVASVTPDETLYERITALQDIIPASTRRSINSKFSTASSWVKSGLSLGGKTLWVVSTSALLLGVPWALAYSEEQMLVEQEREMQMAQRSNEFLTPGAQPQIPQGAQASL
ncbi:mitochondrial import translocase, subunit Tom22 [Aaosphaeria arxii CBS 175.79]|uniref:Mitochondrial import translocase, subunit Tom22 n=1 Tax=Aaosphaeria arxii CBS 175.79 TaxID=1450172 RepID=A0A6A5XPF5_9PLEO|nr:mitochondrial import translocase, subunit Tom22 [Aaosphaeria arxii CBS 175.79]KAF2014823.1 mitochondrial import translocase, subunit Tom22 [Aaosphaeria arxii CBS 175.79]